jgi:hypothetical protein
VFATNAGTLVSALTIRSHLALMWFDHTCVIPADLTITPHLRQDLHALNCFTQKRLPVGTVPSTPILRVLVYSNGFATVGRFGGNVDSRIWFLDLLGMLPDFQDISCLFLTWASGDVLNWQKSPYSL